MAGAVVKYHIPLGITGEGFKNPRGPLYTGASSRLRRALPETQNMGLLIPEMAVQSRPP